jgi:flagellar motor protein MotB
MAVSGEQPIIIKKVKKVVGGGHHGGAWKVAYADFVTAMMAFFLLMWLLNSTSPEQKQGIADYFAPASISSTTSGSGGILGGTSLGDDGAKADGKMSVIQQMAPKPRTISRRTARARPRPVSTRPARKPCATPWPRRSRTASPRPPSRCASRCRTCRSSPSCPSRS